MIAKKDTHVLIGKMQLFIDNKQISWRRQVRPSDI